MPKTFLLEINNISQESIPIHVRLSDNQNDVIYSKEISLDPRARINLKPYRNGETMTLKISHENNVLFNREVEPFEGYNIKLLSESEVEVEHKIS